MTCKDFEALIALDRTNDLPAAESKQIQAHLSRCDACRAFAGELSADLEWLQAAHQQPPDPAVLHQVRVGVMRQLESKQRRWNHPYGGLTLLHWRWQWVAATAAVILLAGIFSWNPSERQQSVEAKKQQQAKRLEIAQAPQAGGDTPRFESQAKRPEIKNRASASSQAAAAPLGKQPEAPPQRQLAAHAGDIGAPAEARTPRDRLGSEAQVEIITALIETPQQELAETVMLKIPTNNPDIAIYWLMDDETKPQLVEHNEGD